MTEEITIESVSKQLEEVKNLLTADHYLKFFKMGQAQWQFIATPRGVFVDTCIHVKGEDACNWKSNKITVKLNGTELAQIHRTLSSNNRANAGTELVSIYHQAPPRQTEDGNKTFSPKTIIVKSGKDLSVQFFISEKVDDSNNSNFIYLSNDETYQLKLWIEGAIWKISQRIR